MANVHTKSLDKFHQDKRYKGSIVETLLWSYSEVAHNSVRVDYAKQTHRRQRTEKDILNTQLSRKEF